MPVILSMKFDGGFKTWNRGLEHELDGLRDFRPIWKRINRLFEGKSELNPSPILEIWKSEGDAIGSDWTNTIEYEEWKQKYGMQKRVYNVPISKLTKQILSGQTLQALLDSSSTGAIREYGNRTFVYGVQNPYSKKWQDERKILDFFPKMERAMDREVVEFIKRRGKGLGIV